MKVKITESSKAVITVAEMAKAKAIIKSMKDDEQSAAEAAAMLLKASGNYPLKVYEATAEISKNCRAWNVFCDGSGMLDVWIYAEALTENGFIMVGAMISDIWQLPADGNRSDIDDILSHTYFRKFIEA